MKGSARIVLTLVNFVILLRIVLRVTRISSYLVGLMVVPVHKTVEKLNTAIPLTDSARSASPTVMIVLTGPRVLNVFQGYLYPLLVRTVMTSAMMGSTLTRQLGTVLVVILLVHYVGEVKIPNALGVLKGGSSVSYPTRLV